MDIKAKIEELVGKLKGDGALMEKFKSDPVGTVKALLPVDIPEDAMRKVVDGVRAALAGDKLSGAVDKLKGMFGK